MENSKLSDVKGKELVAAGHAFAKAIGMDTPLIEIAKMVSVLATRLDCALVRGDACMQAEMVWEKAMMAAIGEDGVGCVVRAIAELKAERDALAAENVALKSAISYVCDTDNQPDYQYDGMGCGIEDRGIVDRYESARYGWDEAMERMYSEVIPCASDIQTPATDAYLNSVRAEGVEMFSSAVQGGCSVGDRVKDLAATFAAQLRAGKDGE